MELFSYVVVSNIWNDWITKHLEEIRLLAELVPDNTKYYKKLTPFTDKPELMQQRQDNWDLVILLLDIGALQ